MDQTPIQEVKQRLKQHLKETYIQKSKLWRIIRRLGGKPTDAKADLSRSNLPMMIMRKNFLKTAELNKVTAEKILARRRENTFIQVGYEQLSSINILGYSMNIESSH
jgi:ferritin-like metal-binding protein YciE